MNILHLQNELNYTSGAAKYIYILCKNLPREYQNHLITFSGYDTEKFKEVNVQVREIKKSNLFFDFFKTFFIILNYCIKYKIDVIHSHHRFFDFTAFIVSRFIKVKTIMTVHSIIYGKKLFSYKSGKLIAVSNAVKEHLINYYKIKDDKIIVKYNPIDEEDILEANPDETGFSIPDGYKVISYFGRYDYEKGFDIYLKAVKELLKKNMKLIFLFIGSGEYEKLLELIKNNNNVKIFLPQKKIYSYLKLTDLLVLTSRRDPFPYLMLEAGILKIPLLGSAVDGIEEFIDENRQGLLFQKENADELISKIIFALENMEEMKRRSENLYEKVIENCNKNFYVKFISGLYSASRKNANI